jgi:hypothetical protein
MLVLAFNLVGKKHSGLGVAATPILRGREAVRAVRRLRTDERHIRAQSAILYKPCTAFGVNQNRVLCTDVPFIRTQNTVGARSAQVRSWHAWTPKQPVKVS